MYYNQEKNLNYKSSWFFLAVNEEGIRTDPLGELLGLVVPNMTTWAGGVGRQLSARVRCDGQDSVFHPNLTPTHFSLCAVVTSTPHFRAEDLGSNPAPCTSSLGNQQIIQSYGNLACGASLTCTSRPWQSVFPLSGMPCPHVLVWFVPVI